MHKINKTFFPTEKHENSFQRLCNEHIDELRIHKKHMAMVEKTQSLPDGDPNKYQPYPAPVSHPDVMASVVPDGDDFNVKYEVFDDKTLEEKKSELVHAATEQAAKLQEKIMPKFKRPLLHIQVGQIEQKILSLYETDKLHDDGSTKNLSPENKHKKIREEIIKKLPADDQQKLLLNDQIAKKSFEVIHHLAKLQDAIHDLDEKTIVDWKPEAFPEV